MSGHDHLIKLSPVGHVRAWEVMTQAGRVRAVTYTAPDAELVKAALDGPSPARAPAPAADLPRIYLDLDGVMADFDNTFPRVFGLDHRDMADDEMWARINSHPDFFRNLPAMPGAYDFMAWVRHLQPIILTACPKSNYAHVAWQKREWVREHLGPGVTVLPVWGGASKPLFMHAPGDILIDDYRRNTEAWAAAGGVAILHRDWWKTRAALVEAISSAANDNNPARVERKGVV
ncbi:MAG TPA: hypothetical protein VGE09_11385 [Pseudoxanthomonas sp.]